MYGGSYLSKYVGLLGFLLELSALFALCSESWATAATLLFLGLSVSYVGYRLAGGSRNAALRRGRP